ncbi:alpha/beta fold hydrolase [Nocardiopsis sediminis]|uniref:Alpha/beta fold hydrolase n=1 Tax=Nocardiopsis sediminis TaxID=1778267 RepID=A0ABV8FQD7_9ACTN
MPQHHLAPGADPLVLRVGDLAFDALSAGPQDGPPVLFLHGFPEFATCWRAHMAAVARAGFRAIAVDQRGYSPGARPEHVDAYALPGLVDDAFGFADALELERFHLVGHDWGGLVAWPAAARHPERVATLSVLSTPHPAALAEAMAESAEQREKLSYIGLFRIEGQAERVLLEDGGATLAAVYEGRVAADLVADNVRRLSEPGALTAALNWYRALDSRTQANVPAITVPTLYLWGDHDLAFSELAAERTAGWVSGPYTYVPLEGASHWLPEEQPERVIAPLLAHLTAHT